MAILAVPMYLLFELSIGLVSLAERRAAASERALEQNLNLEERRI
jgi:Sec-independent protein secretion pathway component TatC